MKLNPKRFVKHRDEALSYIDITKFWIHVGVSNKKKSHLFQRFELSCEGEHMQSGRLL